MARETAKQRSGQEKEQTGKEREKKKQVRKGDEKIEKEGKTRASKRGAEKQLDTETEVERGEGEYELDGALKVLLEEGISAKRYRALKRDLIGIEEENTSEIILQKCAGKGDWFEMGDNSALIYSYYVCKPLKKKDAGLVDDYDSFFHQYRIGRIRVRGVEKVRRRLRAVNLYGGERLINDRVVFGLIEPLKREQIEKLKRFEAERRMKLNKTLAVQHVDPLFFRNLAQLANELHRACSAKMTKLDSQTVGARIVTLTDAIMAKYFHSADLPKGKIKEAVKDWTEIRALIYQLKYEIQITDVANIWEVERCAKYYERIITLKRRAEGNLERLLSGKPLKEEEKTGEAREEKEGEEEMENV